MLPPDRRFTRLKTVQDFNLSPMENRVIAMMYNGDSNKQIAAQLHISENTVKHHITSIFSKCKVTSRAHLLSMLRKDQIML